LELSKIDVKNFINKTEWKFDARLYDLIRKRYKSKAHSESIEVWEERASMLE